MNIKLLVRDLADTVRHPCDLSDTVPSDDPLIRLDEDGYKIVALSDFEPSKLASTELLRIRVAAGCGQGGRIWGGVSLLCLYLQEMFGECKEPQAPGWRVLELGAGIGVCGLCAAAISPNLHVTISDGLPLLLSLANKNVDLNAGKFVSIPQELLLLDWEQLPELTHQSARSYQIVMGSDIVYDGIDLHAIWNAVDWSLDYTAGAQFVLSHERKCDGFEEDEWLLAFRAQGGTMGFIIVYQHMADDVYLDVWERNT